MSADRILVVSASFGGYDDGPYALPEQTVPVDRISVRDDRRLGDGRVAAKRWKLTLDSSYDYQVWVDGNAEVVSPSFVEEAVETVRDGVVAAFAHPRRSCVYDEVAGSLDEAPVKYGPIADALAAQILAYRAERYPADAGLWACGVLAWNLGDARAVSLAAAWLAECERYTMQDQVSFPVVARRLGVVPSTFPIPQIERRRRWFGNRWVRLHPHNRED